MTDSTHAGLVLQNGAAPGQNQPSASRTPAFAALTGPAARSVPTATFGLAQQYRIGDRFMLAALLLYALAALAIAVGRGQPGMDVWSTLGWVAGASLPGLLGYTLAPGRLAARLGLATSLAMLVALHIQLAAGMIEFHFGVFVTLALLMVYLDWRPIVLAAALFAAHHLGFDRLQAAGWGVYCLAAPNLAVILLHAAYVVVQTALEVVLVVTLAHRVRANAEVAELAAGVRQGRHIALAAAQLDVSSPIAASLKQVLVRLGQVIATVRQAGSRLAGASTQMSEDAQVLTQRTQEAVQALSQATVRMQAMREQIHQSAEAAAQSEALVRESARVTERGDQAVAQVRTAMDNIHQNSLRIADITSVIDTLAFQTNLLALNAAVEAARAGEQGRGFAVVAGEVRALAQRSASAAGEIRSLIDTSAGQVEAGRALTGTASNTMAEIRDSVQEVAGIVHKMAAMASGQSAEVEQLAVLVDQTASLLHDNAGWAARSEEVAEALQHEVRDLARALAVFQTPELRAT